MKIIKTILYSLLFTCIYSTQLQSSPTPTLPWSIVIYMEASAGHLYQAAFKNLDEIVRNTPDNAHVFVFLHTQGATGWLYHVTKNNLHKIANIACDVSVAQTLIDVMTIAVSKGPAKHHGLILWNHGYGILDPVYDKQNNDWSVPYDGPYNVGCSLKRSHSTHNKLHRGMCVNNNLTFLSNTDMVYAFDIICNTLLNGKKLAFCGMDLCKGAMFEHAYQLCDYADYFLGSQECEMVDGWPYDTVLQIINDTPNASPQEVAVHTVDAFREYYEKHTEQNTYTLSALDLSYTQKLKHTIDATSNILTFMMSDNDHVKNILTQLRKECKAFCDAPMYCDLHQWYSVLLNAFDECNQSLYSRARPELVEGCPRALEEILQQVQDERREKNIVDDNSNFYYIFRQLLCNGLDLMSAMTVARCNGSAAAHAHGCSIYFPQFAIDSSYLTALFAQESSWVQFLEQFLT